MKYNISNKRVVLKPNKMSMLHVTVLLCILGYSSGNGVLQKSSLFGVLDSLCPMFKCMAPGPCDVPYKTSTFTTASGKVCYGCMYCPASASQSRRESGFLVCPMFKCIAPSKIPCDVPLEMGEFTTDTGVKCPSCYFCPTTHTTNV